MFDKMCKFLAWHYIQWIKGKNKDTLACKNKRMYARLRGEGERERERRNDDDDRECHKIGVYETGKEQGRCDVEKISQSVTTSNQTSLIHIQTQNFSST